MIKKTLYCGIFISDVGFGHMVRQRSIISELLKLYNNIEITVFNHTHLAHLKKKFKNKILYVDTFNNILLKKKGDGGLDIIACEKNLKIWEKKLDFWLKKNEKYFPKFDFIISDCVPQAFLLSKKYNIKSFCVCHYTWDWFFEKICKSGKNEISKLQECFKHVTHFFFPPLTPNENFLKYKNKSSKVNFIIGKFKKKNNQNFKLCSIFDNGTKVLSKLIQETISYLKFSKNIIFFVNIENLRNAEKKKVYESKNIIPVNGLKEMHESLNETDFIVARGGFNTISESLVLRIPALFSEEKQNPEVQGNINLVCNKMKLAKKIKMNEWRENFNTTINKFIRQDAQKIFVKLKKKRYKENGAYQVAKSIMQKVK